MESARERAATGRVVRVRKPVVLCTWLHVLIAVAIIPLSLHRLDIFVPIVTMTRNCISCVPLRTITHKRATSARPALHPHCTRAPTLAQPSRSDAQRNAPTTPTPTIRAVPQPTLSRASLVCFHRPGRRSRRQCNPSTLHALRLNSCQI